jgi:predicted nucleotidyltransferase
MNRRRLLRFLEEFLARTSEGLMAGYLFGSWARNTARTGSDVDLGLLYRRAPEGTLDSPPRRLESELEIVLGLPVEVVVLNSAPPDLVHRIMRDGEIVLDRDRTERIRFEVRARNEYFDLLPILERYRRSEPVVQ